MTNTKPQKVKAYRKLIKLLVRLTIYIPLITLTLFALLVGTSFGTRLSIIIAEFVLPPLSINYHSGTLNKSLKLNSIKWEDSTTKLDIENLQLAWQPTCLLQKNICVNYLASKSIKLTLNTPKKTTSSHKQKVDSQFSLPFGIHLKQAKLKQIDININQMLFATNQLFLSANWQSSGLKIDELKTTGLAISIPSNKEQDVKSDNNKHSQWPLAKLPTISAPFPIEVNLLDLHKTKLELPGYKDTVQRLQLTGNFKDTQLDIGHLFVSSHLGELRLNGQLDLTHDYPMQLGIKTHLIANNLLPEVNNQTIDLALTGSLNNLSIDSKINGDISADITAQIDLMNANLPYQFKLTSSNLHWPIVNPQYHLSNINLFSEGSLDSQDLKLTSLFNSPYYPLSKITADIHHQGSIPTGKMTVKKLAVEAKKSALNITGKLSYQAQANKPLKLTWQTHIQGDGINPDLLKVNKGTQLPRGNLRLDINSDGQLTDKNWHVALNKIDIKGELEKYPVQVIGDLKINDNLQFESKKFQATAFNSSLDFSGKGGNTWDLKGQVTIPELAKWQQDVKGKLVSQFVINEVNHKTQLTSTSHLSDFNFQDINLSSADLNINADMTGANQFAVNLTANKLTYQAHQLTKISLHAKGDRETQISTLSAIGDIDINTELVSRFDQLKQVFSGELLQLSINSKLGQWQSTQPILLTWIHPNQTAEIGKFCLINNTNEICLNNDLRLSSASNTTAKVSFKGDLGQLGRKYLPRDIQWYGPSELDALFQINKLAKPTAQLTLQLHPGVFTFIEKDQPSLKLDYQNGLFSAKLNDNQLTINTHIEANNLLQLDSNIKIDVGNEHKIKGKVLLSNGELAILQNIFPQISNISGTLTANLELDGKLSKPKVKGNIAINNGMFATNINPTPFENINASLIFDGLSTQIKGSWQMGHGMAHLSGALNWDKQQPSGDIFITGNKLTSIIPPMAVLNIAPDIHIKLTPEHTNITGDLTISGGDVTLMQLAKGGIPVSSDLVFTDHQDDKMTGNKAYSTNIALNIKLSDKITIKGMGLKGDLQGKLTLQQRPTRPMMLFGEIQVANGSYQFLGQALEITTGELQFIGPPDSPNLNITAIRKVKQENANVTAGIRITGTAKNPQVTLFSNPAMEQAEILSYIIKGSSFNNKEDNDALMLSLAMQLSSTITDNALGSLTNTASGLMDKIGISNLQLDTDDEGRFAISGFIGDRLMLKYGIGVFNPGYELTVRYYLLARLYLETVSSSLAQSLDIYYSFDF